MAPDDRVENAAAPAADPREFVAGLDRAETLVLTIRQELYEGSWESMVEDLEARLAGKPYIFKLSQRIENDLATIRKLRDYEERHGVDLGDYL